MGHGLKGGSKVVGGFGEISATVWGVGVGML